MGEEKEKRFTFKNRAFKNAKQIFSLIYEGIEQAQLHPNIQIGARHPFGIRFRVHLARIAGLKKQNLQR